jgi:hypothetical protein
MTQEPLFCDDIYEALRTIGQAYGGSKKIGAYLWPDKPLEKASELWANCLNRTRPEKLDPEQVLAVLKIGRQIGSHVGVHFIAEQCGYRFEAIEPEDERAKLMREFNFRAAELQQMLNKLEKL